MNTTVTPETDVQAPIEASEVPDLAPEVVEPLPPKTFKERAQEAWYRISMRQKITLAVAIATILALIISVALFFKVPAYGVLFANLSDQDSGEIVEALSQMKIVYRITEGTGSILIPTEQVREVRFNLATKGLPKGGHVSFEVMDTQKFGISQFAEQVNYQRALQGELARTIESISAVRSARVHLAIPRPTVFVREDQKPTASVFLNMYPGRFLDQDQIAGIRNLVAASVPNLSAASISLVDQDGNWISRERDRPSLQIELDTIQQQRVADTEAAITRRIDESLLPIFGTNNAKAQVSVEMDFSAVESTEEKFDPNVATRSTQTNESINANPTATMGVPGALTNQPPIPPTAPLTNPPIPPEGTAPGANPNTPPVPGSVNVGGINAAVGDIGRPISTTKAATANFEVGRTVTHRKNSTGVIKRLTAAVTVNHKKDNSKAGSSPLSDEELLKITNLVKGAMGFDEKRGDQVAVVNTSFTPIEKDEIPLWKNPEVVAQGLNASIFVIIGLVILSIILFVLRPIAKAMMPPPPPPPPEPEEQEIFYDEAGNPVDEEGNPVEVEPGFELQKSEAVLSLEKMIEDARSLVKSDPMIVVNIIKDWVGSGPGQQGGGGPP